MREAYNMATSLQWHHALKANSVPWMRNRFVNGAFLVRTWLLLMGIPFSLLDEEDKMLVILRMNVNFMEFMREHYAHVVANQPWKMTIVEWNFSAYV